MLAFRLWSHRNHVLNKLRKHSLGTFLYLPGCQGVSTDFVVLPILSTLPHRM
jgi:hypothetical protein